MEAFKRAPPRPPRSPEQRRRTGLLVLAANLVTVTAAAFLLPLRVPDPPTWAYVLFLVASALIVAAMAFLIFWPMRVSRESGVLAREIEI